MAGMTARRARLVLAVVIALLLIVGCGGSSSVKPAAYVKSVCKALGNWKNTIQSAAGALHFPGPGRGRDEHGLRPECLPLLEAQRAVVHAAR